MTERADSPITPSRSGDVTSMLQAWENRDRKAWAVCPGQYVELGSTAIEFGQQALAYDVLTEGTGLFPREAELGYLFALSATNLGSLSTASAILDRVIPRLAKTDRLFVEAVSLRGRIEKERWARDPDSQVGQTALTDSAAYYLEAYAASGEFFPGINAASLQLLAGNTRTAVDLAGRVLEVCLNEGDPDVWVQATIGEAHLVAGRQEKAATNYAAAARLAGPRLGQIATMRRQVKLLARIIDVEPAIWEALNVGRVVVFSGHMIDEPDREPPRFPSELADATALRMRRELDQLDARVGYSSLASGGDILFCEAMQTSAGECNIILPFAEDDFIETSVRPSGLDWVARFQAAKEGPRTSFREAVADGFDGDTVLFEYCSDLLQGEAILRAQRLETEAVFLALLDSTSDLKPGGTLATLDKWRASGRPFQILNPQASRSPINFETQKPTPVESKSPRQVPVRPHVRKVFSCLFADMVGFGDLRDSQIPAFFEHYLGRVALALKESGTEPEFFNTWGDGIFLVFRDPTVAAEFALLLRDTVKSSDWQGLGLPENTDIRIALHSGPIFQAWDPILERENFFGEHVTRAARLEPATARGSVFVTEEVASLLSMRPSSRLACDYLGEVVLPKESAARRIYRLRRVL